MTNKLRIYRAIAEVSQQALADAIGVSRQTINAMEKGKYVPSTVLALKLARYFKVSVEDLFALDNLD